MALIRLRPPCDGGLWIDRVVQETETTDDATASGSVMACGSVSVVPNAARQGLRLRDRRVVGDQRQLAALEAERDESGELVSSDPRLELPTPGLRHTPHRSRDTLITARDR